jgi:hypothetical protein
VSWLLSNRYVDVGFYGFALPAVLASLFISAVPKPLPLNEYR